METKAILRYLKMSPRKVRLVADLIRGLPISKALDQLQVAKKISSLPLRKLLGSAIANAEAKSMNKDQLYIKRITVDGGSQLKRWRPRAFGRAAPIRHHTSHITIVLDERKPPKL